MAIRNSTTNTVTIDTATVDDQLLPIQIGTTYKQITNFTQELSKGITLSSNGLKVHTSGIYRFGGRASLRHSQNTTTVGILFAIRRNGIIVANTPSPVPSRVPNIGDIGTISGEGLSTLLAGDSVEVYVAANKVGVVSIQNCTITG